MYVIYNDGRRKEIRELVVIDGWDKMLNGDYNKKKKPGKKNSSC
jgi:hypothetical protein